MIIQAGPGLGQQIEQRRTQPAVDMLFNRAHGVQPAQREREPLDLSRPRGQRGSGEPRQYDFGDKYSVPAEVVDGKIKRLVRR